MNLRNSPHQEEISSAFLLGQLDADVQSGKPVEKWTVYIKSMLRREAAKQQRAHDAAQAEAVAAEARAAALAKAAELEQALASRVRAFCFIVGVCHPAVPFVIYFS